MRQDILSNDAHSDQEPNSFLVHLDAGNINEKLAVYVKQGVDYAKKSVTPHAAWQNILAQYNLELAESDFKNNDEANENDFEKLQEKFKSLLETKQKINASFGD